MVIGPCRGCASRVRQSRRRGPAGPATRRFTGVGGGGAGGPWPWPQRLARRCRIISLGNFLDSPSGRCPMMPLRSVPSPWRRARRGRPSASSGPHLLSRSRMGAKPSPRPALSPTTWINRPGCRYVTRRAARPASTAGAALPSPVEPSWWRRTLPSVAAPQKGEVATVRSEVPHFVADPFFLTTYPFATLASAPPPIMPLFALSTRGMSWQPSATRPPSFLRLFAPGPWEGPPLPPRPCPPPASSPPPPPPHSPPDPAPPPPGPTPPPTPPRSSRLRGREISDHLPRCPSRTAFPVDRHDHCYPTGFPRSVLV